MAKMSLTEKYLKKKSRIRSTGFPIGAIAHYGPTDQVATKVVVSIIGRNNKQLEIKKWFSSDEDVRLSADINEQIVELLQKHNVHRVGMVGRIIGCPHQEGIDYPEGKTCPECTFWQGRDRWTGELYN
ncbi:MAG: hypothetical protein GY943_01025 [Chloroflexi bacterium]|nr:hypothetical protein [Chloroflexota bacterium]